MNAAAGSSAKKVISAPPADPFVEINQRADAADAAAKEGVKKADNVYGVGKKAEKRDLLTEAGKAEVTKFIGDTGHATICAQQGTSLVIATDAIKAVTAGYSEAAVAGANAALDKLGDNRDKNKQAFDGLAAAASKLTTSKPCEEPAPAPAPQPKPQARAKRSDN